MGKRKDRRFFLSYLRLAELSVIREQWVKRRFHLILRPASCDDGRLSYDDLVNTCDHRNDVRWSHS